MSIVSSTAVFTLEPQSLDRLRTSRYVHAGKSGLRRKRKTTAFKNVMIKMPDTTIVFLVYQNGRCVVLGSRSTNIMNKACDWLAKEVKSGILEPPSISNFVYTFQTRFPEMGSPEAMSRLCARLQGHHEINNASYVRYESELSPAVMVHPPSYPRATAMIFRSGKVTITGLRDQSTIIRVRTELERLLKGVNLSEDVTTLSDPKQNTPCSSKHSK